MGCILPDPIWYVLFFSNLMTLLGIMIGLKIVIKESFKPDSIMLMISLGVMFSIASMFLGLFLTGVIGSC